MIQSYLLQESDEAIDTEGALPVVEQSELSDWIKSTLGQKVGRHGH